MPTTTATPSTTTEAAITADPAEGTIDSDEYRSAYEAATTARFNEMVIAEVGRITGPHRAEFYRSDLTARAYDMTAEMEAAAISFLRGKLDREPYKHACVEALDAWKDCASRWMDERAQARPRSR